MSHVKAPKRRRLHWESKSEVKSILLSDGKRREGWGVGEGGGLASEIPADCENYVCSERDGHTRTTTAKTETTEGGRCEATTTSRTERWNILCGRFMWRWKAAIIIGIGRSLNLRSIRILGSRERGLIIITIVINVIIYIMRHAPRASWKFRDGV